MTKLYCSEFKAGRRFIGRLPHGRDVIRSIEDFCKGVFIQMASFSVIGAVSAVTIGSYDQKQQVYVTEFKEGPFEIVSCIGNISLKDGAPTVHAHVVLADMQGETIAGHLFSETTLFAGEIDLAELTGKPLERTYDDITGLMLWKMPS
jgi:predicted DNA-binding protein with PD1-like motif